MANCDDTVPVGFCVWELDAGALGLGSAGSRLTLASYKDGGCPFFLIMQVSSCARGFYCHAHPYASLRFHAQVCETTGVKAQTLMDTLTRKNIPWIVEDRRSVLRLFKSASSVPPSTTKLRLISAKGAARVLKAMRKPTESDAFKRCQNLVPPTAYHQAGVEPDNNLHAALPSSSGHRSESASENQVLLRVCLRACNLPACVSPACVSVCLRVTCLVMRRRV